MKTKPVAVMVVAVVLLMVSGPVMAHHGKTAFDMDKLTVLKGTITRFEFVNPHAIIYIDVIGDKGSVEHWLAESSSNNHLSRGGYDKNSLKPGDQVTISGHRAKNGANTLELQCQECSVADSQGKVLLGYIF
jgi:hypothetical protein